MGTSKKSRRRSRLRPLFNPSAIDASTSTSVHDKCCSSLYPEPHSSAISCQRSVFQPSNAQLYCPIDGEKFHLDDSVARLPCGHIFHRDCIIPFLSSLPSGGYCPLDGTCASEKDTVTFPFRKSLSRRPYLYKPPVIENVTTIEDEQKLGEFPIRSWIPSLGTEKCSIDGEPFYPGEKVIRCSCAHVFHQRCITPYFNRLDEPICPIDGKRAWNIETLLVGLAERSKETLDAAEGRGGGRVQLYKLPERHSLKNLFSVISNSNSPEESPKHPLTLVKEPFEEEKRGKLYDRKLRRSLPRIIPHIETSSSGNLVDVRKKGGRRFYDKNSRRSLRNFSRAVSSTDDLSSLGSYHRYNDSFEEENDRVFNRKLRRSLMNLGRMVAKGEELFYLEKGRPNTLDRLASVHERSVSIIRRKIALGDRDIISNPADTCCVCGRRLRLEETAVCILQCGHLFHPKCYEAGHSCGCRFEKEEDRNIRCATTFELLAHVATVEELRWRCLELEVYNRERKAILHLDATGNLKQSITLAENATREIKSSLRSRQAL